MAPATANPKLTETIKQARAHGQFLIDPFTKPKTLTKRPVLRVYMPTITYLDVVGGLAVSIGFITLGFVLGRLF